MIFSSQYGFRKGHSTQHAIVDIVNDIQSNMNQRLLSCGLFIDFKKAFDTVDHDVLLDKLNHYGFRGIINSWFSSYRKNRTQTTQVDHYTSDKAVVGCGVPQGSVLEPLLFFLYVNDIHRCSNKLRFYLFADDTNILYADKNLKALETTVNNELQNLCNWLTANKLTLNIFHPYQKRLAYQPKLCMFDNEKNKYVPEIQQKLHLDIKKRPWSCFYGENTRVARTMNLNSPNVGHFFLACRQWRSCDFFQRVGSAPVGRVQKEWVAGRTPEKSCWFPRVDGE